MPTKLQLLLLLGGFPKFRGHLIEVLITRASYSLGVHCGGSLLFVNSHLRTLASSRTPPNSSEWNTPNGFGKESHVFSRKSFLKTRCRHDRFGKNQVVSLCHGMIFLIRLACSLHGFKQRGGLGGGGGGRTEGPEARGPEKQGAKKHRGLQDQGTRAPREHRTREPQNQVTTSLGDCTKGP